MYFISKAKLQIKFRLAVSAVSDNSITNESIKAASFYIRSLSMAWTWPSQPFKCHLAKLQLHYINNLSVLLHTPFSRHSTHLRDYLRYVTLLCKEVLYNLGFLSIRWRNHEQTKNSLKIYFFSQKWSMTWRINMCNCVVVFFLEISQNEWEWADLMWRQAKV